MVAAVELRVVRWKRLFWVLAVPLVVGGCGDDRRDDMAGAGPEVEAGSPGGVVDYDSAASWKLDQSAPPPQKAQSQFAVVVDGLACSGGQERTVRPPKVSVEDEQVVVTFSVEPLPSGNYNCQGIPGLPYTVDVGELIGDRRLVDGFCLQTGPLVKTAYCASDGGVRWSP